MTKIKPLNRLELLEMWEWPEDARELLLGTLVGPSPEDRARAASLLHVIVDEEVASALIARALDAEEDEEVRGAAAIALGPALESADDELSIGDGDGLSEEAVERIASTLERLYREPSAPTLVRRRALEAAVRSPREWHAAAIRAAWAAEDPDWKQTAVFCMGHVRGFEDVVREVLDSGTEPLVAEAVKAASMHEGIARLAEPALVRLARSSEDRDVQLDAIEALGGAQSSGSLELLHELAESDDEEIADVAQEALVMRGVLDEVDHLDDF